MSISDTAHQTLQRSERMFRACFEVGLAGMAVMSPQRQWVYVNDRFCSMLGFATDELWQTTWPQLIHPEDREADVEHFGRVLSGQQDTCSLDERFVCGDGTLMYATLSVASLRAEDGSVEYVIAHLHDITQRERAEQALQASEEKYRRVVDDQTEFIVRWLPGGIRTFVNDSYCRYFHVSREKAIGTSFFPLIPEDYREAVRRRVEALTIDHPASTGQHRVVRQDGTVGWTQWTDRAIFDEQGQLVEYQSVGRDVTDRRLAEDALRESETRYRSLVANIPDVVWTTDQQGRTTFISENVEKVYGYTPDEIYANSEELWLGRIHPQDVERVTASFQSVFERGVQLDIEYRIQRKDGKWIWLHDRSFGAYERGGLRMADGVFHEVTQRKEAEEALIESERSLREMSNAAFEGIASCEDGRITDGNEAFLTMFGYRLEEIKGKPVVALVAPEHRAMVAERIRNDYVGVYEHRGIRKDGSQIDIEVHGRTVTRRGRRSRLVAIRDVTERKRAERKLQEYQTQLKSLASDVSLAEERERRRIAVGLHDDIAQKLAMVKLGLQTIQASLADSPQAEALARQSELIGQVVRDVQSLTFDLSNPVLYQFGLEAAVEAYLLERIQGEFGIKCHFSAHAPRQPLEEDLMVVLFQATRELLANVVKHARADEVAVTVDTSGDPVQITVEDNGVGLDPDSLGPYRSAKGGFGLFNVRERLEYLGGTLTIGPGSKKGACVRLTAPLNAGVTA